MPGRHPHFYRICNICKENIYGTKHSHRLHKGNCREKRSRMPEWGKKLAKGVKL